MKRRTWLKSTFAGSVFLPFALRSKANAGYRVDPVRDRIPQKGEEFNESFVFPDQATGRLTRRLTSYRQFNQKPTYHINAGFSMDDLYLCFNTWNPDSGSALVRANVETGDCKVIDSAPPGSEYPFMGQSLFMIPKTNYVSLGGEQSRLYDIMTLEKTILFESTEPESYYSAATGTCDGRYLVFAKNDHRYNYRQDKDIKDPYKALGFSLFKLDMQTGERTEIYRDETCKGGHIVSNPVYPELIVFHRDFPPKFGHGGDHGKTSRDWILNIHTGELTEIQPRNTCKFTWHANWSADGKYIYYHGPSHDRPYKEKVKAERPPYKDGWGSEHFIGVADLTGDIVWEKVYPYLYYGHASSHAIENIIIIDNLLAYEYISGIHWQDRDNNDNPRIELIGKHNSTYAPGAQTRHPHCQMSNDGKWISYNAQFDDRSDVYVLQMK
ncbi:hypothetical protein GF406_21740 [candidate division KSB1 bacterium]|nr:hypothetical protein [candidate division KSB1 bacterium]